MMNKVSMEKLLHQKGTGRRTMRARVLLMMKRTEKRITWRSRDVNLESMVMSMAVRLWQKTRIIMCRGLVSRKESTRRTGLLRGGMVVACRSLRDHWTTMHRLRMSLTMGGSAQRART